MGQIRVIHFGIGWIGAEAARLVLRKQRLQIVGAVDQDKKKIGRDLGDILNLPQKLGIRVTDSLQSLLARTDAEVVVHTTGSRLRDIYPQIEEIISAKINVVSSAEELLLPEAQYPEIATELDQLAKANGVTLLGTGVNPGFVMDSLPLFLTSVCQEIRRIRVERVVDASTRRPPLQKKIGAGLTPQQFREKVKQGKLGHVGLVESLSFIASGLGWQLSQIKESVEPVVAEAKMETEYVTVKEGEVLGLRHTAQGYKNGNELITLELQIYLGASDPHDSIQIEGRPELGLRINGGTAGDTATAAMLVNCIPRVVEAPPGLLTMKDMPLPYAII